MAAAHVTAVPGAHARTEQGCATANLSSARILSRGAQWQYPLHAHAKLGCATARPCCLQVRCDKNSLQHRAVRRQQHNPKMLAGDHADAKTACHGTQAHTPNHRQRAHHHSPPPLHTASYRCCTHALNASPACCVTSTARGCCHHQRRPCRLHWRAPNAAKTARASSIDPRCDSKARDSGHWPCYCAPSRLHSNIRTRGGLAFHRYRKRRHPPSACHRLWPWLLAPRAFACPRLPTRSPL